MACLPLCLALWRCLADCAPSASERGRLLVGRCGGGAGRVACFSSIFLKTSNAFFRLRQRSKEHWHTSPYPRKNSDVKQKVQHITIFNDVFLAFGAHFACFFCALFAFEGDEVFKGDGLGADEAAFKVAVDDACGLGGGVAYADGPGAYFFYACGEVGLQPEQGVCAAYEAIRTWFALAKLLQKFGAVGFVHFCEF